MHAWTYDAIGNRLTNTVNGVPQSYTYFKNGSNPLNGQRLSSDSINTYTYNPNGNTLTRNGQGGNFTFTRDYDDRMTSISGAATASYTYDYQGRRTSKTVSGSTTSYLYDGLNLIRATGSSTGDYLFGPSIDEPLAMSQGSSVHYFAVDGLGSVSLLTDPSGAVQDAYLYDAWGVTKSQSGTLANDFGYTAREFAEAGLSYYRARYYDRSTGSFLSEDPLLAALSRNRVLPDELNSIYRYAQAQPTSSRDPLGLKDCVAPDCKREGLRCAGCCIANYRFGLCVLHQAQVWKHAVETAFTLGGAVLGGLGGKNVPACVIVAGMGYLTGKSISSLFWEPLSDALVTREFRNCMAGCEETRCLENPGGVPCHQYFGGNVK